MKAKILKAARLYILPVIVGLIAIFIEMHVGEVFLPMKCYAVDFIILVVLAAVVLLINRNFLACGSFLITICILPLVLMIFNCLFQKNVYLGDVSVFIVITNWLGITAPCVVIQFFQKKDRIKDFSRFFRICSLVFLAVYIFSFVIALFFGDYRMYMMEYHIRSLNLIPFVNTIIPYITGTAHTSFFTPIINMLSNILLFLPIGFYLTVFSKKIQLFPHVITIIGVPVCVEALQYIFACGTADIDDVIVNSIGGFLGAFLCLGAEKAYRSYQKNSEAKIFAFK